jgi:hypothetical protein
LWLTSETVLRRVLHAGIFSDSEAHLERIHKRLCRYVPNSSFHRARSLLEQSQYCIITGIPGIGKTTLAEVLLADLVDRQGFEAFRIAHNLSEIRPVKNTKRKQVFYFDDFLGKTTLEKLEKNEDQRIVELIEEVAENPLWRFILTTREYILNNAKVRYEAFAQPSIDFRLCVIVMADYTRPIRAKILYNHIYFSDLPRAHKLALLQHKSYESILSHRNYNPRVIEYMTQTQHACTVSPSLYLNEFTDSLEHPARIWDHAFRYQISESARHLLLVLATLPDEVLLDDLESAFWTFYRFRQKQFGFSTRSGDWRDTLKELDGNFLTTHKVGKDIVVSFHNPSIRDFLEDFLFQSEVDVIDLARGAHFHEQYVTLWDGRRGHRYPGIENNREDFLRLLGVNILSSPTANIIRMVAGPGLAPIGFNHHAVSNERRGQFALRVVQELGPDGERFLHPILDALRSRWEQGEADKEDLAKLLAALTDHGLERANSAFVAAKRCLSTKIEEMGDYRAFASFIESYDDEVSPTELELLQTQFLEFAKEYSQGWDDDPDWLRQIAADLEFVGGRLDVDVSEFVESLESQADAAEQERASGESDGDDEDQWESYSKDSSDDIAGMFESLREELED